MTRQNHKRGFNLSSSSSNAVGQPCKGFSLIEAAIVLGVVGAVIGTIWVSAAAMYENHKVNKTVEGIFSTARNIQNLISIRDANVIGESVYITSELIAADAFPKDWVNGSGVKHPFGGYISILNQLTNEKFGMYFGGIPQQVCVKLVVQVSSIGAMAGSRGNGTSSRASLGHIQVNGSGNWFTYIFPVSPDTAATACNQSSNVVTFTFGYTRNN